MYCRLTTKFFNQDAVSITRIHNSEIKSLVIKASKSRVLSERVNTGREYKITRIVGVQYLDSAVVPSILQCGPAYQDFSWQRTPACPCLPSPGHPMQPIFAYIITQRHILKADNTALTLNKA